MMWINEPSTYRGSRVINLSKVPPSMVFVRIETSVGWLKNPCKLTLFNVENSIEQQTEKDRQTPAFS